MTTTITIDDVQAQLAAGTSVTAPRANLSGANLSGADLIGARLSGADLIGARLSGTDLRGADLSGADLRYANLRGANLPGADLRYAYLSSADLRGADLSGADLRYAILRGADLRDASWDGLRVDGLPSHQVTLTPTPAGWRLQVGCWSGTIAGLRALIASDDGWPEARGAEIARRRPILTALADLCDAHAEAHPGVIDKLAAAWPADTKAATDE